MLNDDPILFTLVMMAEDWPEFPEVGVTLNTHGFLVTGVLCNRREYMIEAEAFASGIAGIETGKAVASLHQYVRDAETVKREKGMLAERPGDFIHLKNAHFLSSAFHLSGGGVPWRGKTSAIDAWTLGVIER